MSLRHSRKERFEQTQRARWLSNLFTVSMSVVVVAVVLLLPEANAYAQLMDVFADQNSIYYQVYSVQLPSEAKVPSVRLVVESQFETITEELPDGDVQGRISNLRENTQYQVKLVGNKGFGDYLMDQMTIRTIASPQVRLFLETSSLPDSEEVWVSGHFIGELPTDGTLSLWMAVGYGNQVPYRDDYEPIDFTDSAFELSPMYAYGQTLFFLLDWTNSENVTTILVQNTLRLVQESMHSLYLSALGPHHLGVHAYPPSDLGSHVSLELRVLEKSRILHKKVISFSSQDHYESPDPHFFFGLKQNTLYILELWARYYDAILNRQIEKRIDQIEVFTPPLFQIQILEVFQEGAKWEVIVNDPSSVLQETQVMIHFLETNQHYFASLVLQEQVDGTMKAVIQVPNASVGAYEMQIVATIALENEVSYFMVELTRKEGIYE